jgi:hypothetical protein
MQTSLSHWRYVLKGATETYPKYLARLFRLAAIAAAAVGSTELGVGLFLLLLLLLLLPVVVPIGG